MSRHVAFDYLRLLRSTRPSKLGSTWRMSHAANAFWVPPGGSKFLIWRPMKMQREVSKTQGFNVFGFGLYETKLPKPGCGQSLNFQPVPARRLRSWSQTQRPVAAAAGKIDPIKQLSASPEDRQTEPVKLKSCKMQGCAPSHLHERACFFEQPNGKVARHVQGCATTFKRRY